VPDDRFADLGSGTSAGDRLADLDRDAPEQRPEPPPRRRGSYSWVVGVAAVILIAVVSLNTLDDPGEARAGPPVGEPIPRFAAPSAEADLDIDANVNQSRSDPAPGDTPACDVEVPGAIRSCDYTSKPLVLTFIVPTPACEEFVDRVERLRKGFPGVNFVTVVSGPRDQAVEAAADRGWEHPVAIDKSGVVLTRYRLGLCANVVFAYPGGEVRATQTRAQDWTDAQFEAAIRATRRR
jgi:hypothetical protein